MDSGIYEQCSENPDESHPRSFAIQSFSVQERKTPLIPKMRRVEEEYDPSSVPMCTVCGLRMFRGSDPKEQGVNGLQSSDPGTEDKENNISNGNLSPPMDRRSNPGQPTVNLANSPLNKFEASSKEYSQNPVHHPPVSRALIVHQDLSKFNLYGLVRGMGGIFRSFFKGYRPSTIKTPTMTNRSNSNTSPIIRRSQKKTSETSNSAVPAKEKKDLSIRVAIPTTADFADEFGELCSTGPVTVPKCQCKRTLRTVGPASETTEIEESSFSVCPFLCSVVKTHTDDFS